MQRRLSSRFPLPEDAFRSRHRGLLGLLALQVVLLPGFGVLEGYRLGDAALVCAPAAVFGVLAVPARTGRTFRATCCTLGLLSCSAALVWLWHGQTEAHFHYFVMVGAIALYEAAFPYAIAFAFVILQHGLMSAWMPGRVYGSMVAMQHPWEWACIHGGFVGALALCNLVYWRASSQTREREHAAVADSLVSARRFARAFAGAPNGEALLDTDGVILDLNRALAESMHSSASELVGRPWFELLAEADRVTALKSWPIPDGAPEREYAVARSDGGEGWLLFKHSRLADDDPTAGTIMQTVDLSQRRAAERDLVHQANHDALTGLLSRRALVARAQAQLESRSAGQLGVLFVDVDDFKVINDSLGHEAGDELLVAVSHRLSSCADLAALIARFGGDEFVLCQPGASPADMCLASDRIRAAFARPILLSGVERRVSVSVGLALAAAGERSIDSLLRDADLAMYEAKASGKARSAWFDPRMRETAIERLGLESDLRRAIADGELEAFYQPQVSSADGRLVGVEALARWCHPERGFVSPGSFIPIAERSGLIDEVGAQVLRRACLDAADWARRDLRLATITISVNASARCICDEEFPGRVASILAETGMPAGRVCIEVTESAVVENSIASRSVIARLKALGVRIAIDDFGVGQSSLAQLARLGKLDQLKIDKSFIDGIDTNPTACRIAGAIIDVALGDGLEVVAEGVEEIAQLTMLRRLGCPTIQGFLFSPALPSDELVHWVQTRDAGDLPAGSMPAGSGASSPALISLSGNAPARVGVAHMVEPPAIA